MRAIRGTLFALIVTSGCATSEDPESAPGPSSRARRDSGTAAVESGASAPPPSADDAASTPPSEPDASVDPDAGSDTEPPAPEPPETGSTPDTAPAATCEDCLDDCDVVCVKTPSSCKACDDACYAGPCAGGGGGDGGTDPCGCVDACEAYCFFDSDPTSCEPACITSCKASCGK